MDAKKFLKQWRFTLILLSAVAAGALLGHIIGAKAGALKPFGDVFLNLLFTSVVPLIFFSLSSAIAASNNIRRLGRIAGIMLIVFFLTGVVSSTLMVFAVKIFDPAKGLTLQLAEPPVTDSGGLASKIVNSVTVSDFAGLLNRRNMLALIVFAILTGFASQAAGEKGRKFREFLEIGRAHV
jgi:Na+/H+-dicarboxylate symporter